MLLLSLLFSAFNASFFSSNYLSAVTFRNLFLTIDNTILQTGFSKHTTVRILLIIHTYI